MRGVSRPTNLLDVLLRAAFAVDKLKHGGWLPVCLALLSPFFPFLTTLLVILEARGFLFSSGTWGLLLLFLEIRPFSRRRALIHFFRSSYPSPESGVLTKACESILNSSLVTVTFVVAVYDDFGGGAGPAVE